MNQRKRNWFELARLRRIQEIDDTTGDSVRLDKYDLANLERRILALEKGLAPPIIIFGSKLLAPSVQAITTTH